MKKRIGIFLLGISSLVAVSVYAGNNATVKEDGIRNELTYQTSNDSTEWVPCDTTCVPVPCNPAPCNPAPCNPAPCSPGC